MVGQFRLQRSLQDCFGELFQEAVLADDVFRLLVIGQQLINEVLVDSHRFLILLVRWSFTQLLLQLQTNDRAAFLRLAETLTAFLARLRSAAETLSVIERQRIVRLLVKDVLVGEDTITIRHSIPIPSGPPQNGGSQSPDRQNYLLFKVSDLPCARQRCAGWT